jgi:hypothetical protein
MSEMTLIRLVAFAAVALLAFVLVGCGGGGSDAADREILIDLAPQGTEGTPGTLSLSKSGDTTNVLIDVIVPSGGGQQDASFYKGTCADFDESTEIEVGPLEEGSGALTIDTPIDDLLDGGYVIVVHKSVEDQRPISCGPIDVE